MDLEEFLHKLGGKIKRLRKEKGLTQESFDERDHAIPVRTLQEIEAGRSNATVSSIFKIAHKLNVKVKDIFDVDTFK